MLRLLGNTSPKWGWILWLFIWSHVWFSLMQELIMELENSRETVIQLELELESLQSYNSLLLAKVMEHCPQILEMKMWIIIFINLLFAYLSWSKVYCVDKLLNQEFILQNYIHHYQILIIITSTPVYLSCMLHLLYSFQLCTNSSSQKVLQLSINYILYIKLMIVISYV